MRRDSFSFSQHGVQYLLCAGGTDHNPTRSVGFMSEVRPRTNTVEPQPEPNRNGGVGLLGSMGES